MFEEQMNFVQKCLAGEALADEIDDYVHLWHLGEGDPDYSLAQFLGFTDEEYKLWAERPNSIDLIFYARKSDRSLESIHSFDEVYRVAARSLSAEDTNELTEWLKRTGRISD